ncbi:MAG: hypothetical protein ACXVDD_08225 [Polyangia bacterium]
MSTTLLRSQRFPILERPLTQLVVAVGIGWAPLVVLGMLERPLIGHTEALVRDVSVHVRLLLAVPLFLVADLALALQSRKTLERLTAEGFVADDDRARFALVVRRAERLRSAALPGALLLFLALFAGIATLIGWLSPAGAVRGAGPAELGAARLWFALVGMPLFMFLLCRSLWRWSIWVLTLVALARIRLRLAPGHPDRCGGLGFLVLPSLAFHGPFLFAVSSVLCASWGMQVATAGAPLKQFQSPLAAFVAIGELLAFAPLLAFTPRLFLAARAGLIDYGGLATDYVRRFHRRWMAPAPRDDLLGTPDLQSLNDLDTMYRETVQRTGTMVFGPRDLLVLLIVMLLPVLPLLLAVLPVEAVLGKMFKLLLGAR